MSGSHLPQLRFGGFREQWKLEAFGDLYQFHPTNSYSRSMLSNDRGDVFNIHYGDIHTRFNTCFDLSKEDVPRIDPDLAKDRFAQNQHCREGDLVIADASEDYSDIGKSIELVALNGKQIVAGLHTLLARPKNGTMALGFAAYWMQSSRVRHQVKVKAQGTKVLGISAGKLAEVESYLPTLPEQQKIAAFLGAVDRKIQQLKRKQALLEQYKKGVVQQLFAQELRFKREDGGEFPEWEERGAGELFRNHSNKKHNSDLPILAATQERGMVPRDTIGIDIKSSQASISTYKVVEPGDFVISLRSFQGGIEYSEMKGICSPAYIVLKPNEPINEQFFRAYFKMDDFITELSNTVIGIRDGKQITYDNFSSLTLPFPSLEEQTRIAGFLMALDTKVAGVAKAVEAAQRWKKGLLQGMFV